MPRGWRSLPLRCSGPPRSGLPRSPGGSCCALSPASAVSRRAAWLWWPLPPGSPARRVSPRPPLGQAAGLALGLLLPWLWGWAARCCFGFRPALLPLAGLWRLAPHRGRAPQAAHGWPLCRPLPPPRCFRSSALRSGAHPPTRFRLLRVVRYRRAAWAYVVGFVVVVACLDLLQISFWADFEQK